MKKMLPWLITILLAITLIAGAAFVLIPALSGKKSEVITNAQAAQAEQLPRLSADELVEVSSEITGIKTNLADADYIVQMNLSFQLNDAKAKESFEKIKDISIKPIVIQLLADTKPDELRTAKGRDQFSDKLTDLINKSLPEGHLGNAKITDFLLAAI
ncbi:MULTISPECIES: flagellar basal body-associated FliL family protein [Paenibacillus]|uniref:flagellar basal body-associated FliL family protein n=1 Tax=Paenibacillus TaxID=44249 RepID=UPI00077C4031|nr:MULTISPECIES: flagellar basal body-associated FliL family protein [Paenibacillus]KYG92848.1 flagellar basal body protein FliL [Paenibacillus polymyxa]MCP3806047.1 flagellar basal body-associated FliL family protein [Paenibacillus sp. Lou8.1]MDY8045672.1 flagellar basal body-associated FliL family protein [Paenibacillus polymyxa]